MRVRVRLLGSLRPASAPRETEFEVVAGSDVSTLIARMVERYPELAGALGKASSGNLIMLGGVEVGNLSGIATPLGEDSEVVFIPVTHGG
jgi:molybdopterin converting factor small subunit